MFVSVYYKIHTYEGSVSGKIHGEVIFDYVSCYEKHGELADYVFSAKQRPKRSSSALMKFSSTVGVENS